MGLEASASFSVRCARYVRFVLQVLSGLMTVAFLFPFYGRERRWRAVQRWSYGIVSIAGIEVEVVGDVPESSARVLGVVNHVSWLDIQVLHSVWAVRFVAKSEVRNWPAIGWLSARTGDGVDGMFDLLWGVVAAMKNDDVLGAAVNMKLTVADQRPHQFIFGHTGQSLGEPAGFFHGTMVFMSVNLNTPFL